MSRVSKEQRNLEKLILTPRAPLYLGETSVPAFGRLCPERRRTKVGEGDGPLFLIGGIPARSRIVR